MRKRIIILFGSIGLLFGLTSSSSDEYDYEAVIMTRANLEKSIRYEAPRELDGLAKIYYYDHYIFISKRYKGIHVIDNTNPASPVNTGFINIPGCVDMAIRNNILYADNAVDLIAINISDLQNLKVTSRTRNILPEHNYPGMDYIPVKYSKEYRPENTVIVEWRIKNSMNNE